ncbi:MAG: nucleotidyltransferase family protein [Gemmatimonadaceae bacterium]|nr:nucleotidyltransferase family protein [Gemmatimonadaceae bacterium]
MWHEDVTKRLELAIVPPSLTIADALARLDRAGTGVLLLADDDRVLFGIVTDGDIRRHILSGESLDVPCANIATRTPLVATPETTKAEALHLMDHARDFVLNHLPVVDADRRIVGLVLRSDLVSTDHAGLSAVIMAGGFGTRLRPLTDTVPKPMLPVGDRPLLELTVERLRRSGIKRVNVTTHYLADAISNHFGDGHAFGVDMRYVPEDRPLGTAGALRLMEPTDEPLLVLNGDILTTVDFQALLAYHREHRADVTVGVRKYELQVPYGVVECDGALVRALREKPVRTFLVNAGIYLLEPSVMGFIPEGRRFDMTDLIQSLLDAGRRVASFPIVEYWLDIGRMADYEQAQDDVKHARL